MKSVFASLIFAGILIAGFIHGTNFIPHIPKLGVTQHFEKSFPADKSASASDPSAIGLAPTGPSMSGQSASGPAGQPMVIMVSPLAHWMQASNSAKPGPDEASAETPEPANRVVNFSADSRPVVIHNRIAPSPLEGSPFLLHKTFAVSNSVNFPFDVPAHTVNAHLRGNYRSFISQQSIQSSDKNADIAFLLMNDEQYAMFTKDGSADGLLDLDPSHDQNVNYSLPVSGDLPAKYYLVFRNNPREGKKIVQADFKIDF